MPWEGKEFAYYNSPAERRLVATEKVVKGGESLWQTPNEDYVTKSDVSMPLHWCRGERDRRIHLKRLPAANTLATFV